MNGAYRAMIILARRAKLSELEVWTLFIAVNMQLLFVVV